MLQSSGTIEYQTDYLKVAVTAMIATFLVVDALWIPLPFSSNGPSQQLATVLFCDGLVLGFWLSQVTLTTIWTVLVPGRWFVRIPWGCLLLFLFCGAQTIRLRRDGTAVGEFEPQLLMLVIEIAFFSFLFCAYYGRGWRLHWPWRKITSRQFGLRDLFQSLGISAVCMAILRTMLAGWPAEVGMHWLPLLVGLLTMIALIACIGFVSALGMRSILRMEVSWSGLLRMLLVLTTFHVLYVLGAMLVLSKRDWFDAIPVFAILSGLVLMHSVVMMFCFIVLRYVGVRLMHRQDERNLASEQS